MKDEILTVQPDEIHTHSAEIASECTKDAANVLG